MYSYLIGHAIANHVQEKWGKHFLILIDLKVLGGCHVFLGLCQYFTEFKLCSNYSTNATDFDLHLTCGKQIFEKDFSIKDKSETFKTKGSFRERTDQDSLFRRLLFSIDCFFKFLLYHPSFFSFLCLQGRTSMQDYTIFECTQIKRPSFYHLKSYLTF